MSKLFEATFYQKWSQGIEVVQNIFADSKDDAAELLIELDNNEDEPLGLNDLEYSVRLID